MEMKWLFNSAGKPIAFLLGRDVFFESGHYLGRLDDKQEIWHGRYKGEILDGDRLFRQRTPSSFTRAHSGTPATPAIPISKPTAAPASVPTGYEDVEVFEPWVDVT